MSEVVKLIVCLSIVYVQTGGVVPLIEDLNRSIVRQPMDTLKVCVPSFVYIIQNNLLYVSASHLDAATYQVSFTKYVNLKTIFLENLLYFIYLTFQVTYQLKILTTAMFAVFILRKQLLSTQWLSLLTLVLGVILVQLSHGGDPSAADSANQNRLLGFTAALMACVLSGFAGIYFEKILKGSDTSVWMRNIQLSLCSIPFGLMTCFISDGDIIRTQGFFFGYDKFIQYLIILQAGGGLLVAVVVKYADNILKGFATSLAIVISCVASIYLFKFMLTLQFLIGAKLVIFSIFLYGYSPRSSTTITSHKI